MIEHSSNLLGAVAFVGGLQMAAGGLPQSMLTGGILMLIGSAFLAIGMSRW